MVELKVAVLWPDPQDRLQLFQDVATAAPKCTQELSVTATCGDTLKVKVQLVFGQRTGALPFVWSPKNGKIGR